MLRGAAIALVVVLGGCGSAPPAPKAVPVLPARPPEPPRAKLGLPADSIVVGSLATTVLLHRHVRALLDPIAGEIEEELGLSSGSFRADPLEALGIDPARALSFGLTAVSADERKKLDALRSHPPGAGSALQAIGKAIESVRAGAAVRVLVPVTHRKRLTDTLRRALLRDGFKKRGDDVYAARRLTLAIGGDDDVVVLDVNVHSARAGESEPKVGNSEGATAAPELDGAVFRMSYSPAALAYVSYAYALGAIHEALRYPGVDKSEAESIAAEGLAEAGEAFAIAGRAAGGDFERIELGVSLDDTRIAAIIRARAAKGIAWPSLPASASVAVSPVAARLDVSRALIDSWPAPIHNRAERKAFERSVRNAGGLGPLIALPTLLVLGGPTVIEEAVDDVPALDVERTAWFATAPNDRGVFVGVFPQTASRLDAECAFAAKSPCAAKEKLSWTATSAPPVLKGKHARLRELNGRFVVLVAEESTALSIALPPDLTPTPSIQIAASREWIGQMLHLPPPFNGPVSGSAERVGDTMELRLETSP